MTKEFFERGKKIAKWADKNMTKDEELSEIHDSPSITMEIPMPTKITGYAAFYRSAGQVQWGDVYQLAQKTPHPILPHDVFESRDEAIKAAMQISWLKPISIKIVAMEFEI